MLVCTVLVCSDVISRVEERIARWTMVPAGNGEGIQVLRYDVSMGMVDLFSCAILCVPNDSIGASQVPVGSIPHQYTSSRP